MYGSSDIMTEIKITRLRLAAHIQRMNKSEIAKRNLDGKPERRRTTGRPKNRRLDRWNITRRQKSGNQELGDAG